MDNQNFSQAVEQSSDVKAYSPKPIEEMTDSEKLDEILYWMRECGRALSELQNGSMMKNIMGMFGGLGK